MRVTWGDVAAAEKAKKEVNTFIFAVADSGMGGWGQCRNVIELEKLGKPGIFVVGDNALHTARMSARDSGMPALRIVSLPSIDYYPNRSTVAGLRPVAKAHLGLIVDALTKLLTPEEKNPALIPQKEIPDTIQIAADSYESALEKFNRVYLENHWGDGLPLIPPTKKAVKRMLAGTKRSPGEILGKVPVVNPEETHIIVSGSVPGYSFGMSYLRSAHKTKLIKGATLTKSGR